MIKALCKLAFSVLIILISSQCLAQIKIDTTETLWVGGIKQVIKIEGADRSKPIFLFITGGTGSEGIYDENKTYLDELKKHFTVVAWDQRNCGQTLLLNPSPVKLTVKLYENDTHELVTALLTQLGQKKLFLMGWSWGTVPGFYMTDKHPDQLYAYIAVSPVVNQLQGKRILLLELKQKAVAQKNIQATSELATVKIPFEDGLQNYYDRKWLFVFNGEAVEDTVAFKKYFTKNAAMMALFKEASHKNLTVSLPKINCPVYFFVGRTDQQTNFVLSEKYYNQLIVKNKALFWFDKSAHQIPVTEPSLLQEIVIKKILPQIKLVK